MPRRQLSPSGVRDALLVVMVAALAFALGAITPGPEVDDASIPVFGAVRGSAARSRAEPVPTPGTISRSPASIAPDQTDSSLDRPRLAPAPTRVAAIPAERFSGEGAGRGEHIIASDPHNRRSYILDTASLMHRRGWIGLDDRVAEATSGDRDNRSQPAALSGPR